ncbi:hypothetical protein [Seinonella peptonophila]|uniref:hypothetical protein n=1 Tax=Seinonella peptonophila TaxID=112248 RepID=UPI00093350FE|nr:hypothetical protein [Seinonella peptonophila]
MYEDVVLSWFETSIEDDQHCVMLEALIKGDIETFQSIFQDLVLKTFSMFDTSANEPEKVDFR